MQAIEIFGCFLRETPCCLLLQAALWILDWGCVPQQQIRRLLEALHTNRSVKELHLHHLDNVDASWIADLLQHKTDFTGPSILPVLRVSR
jgi:hypothetical protein